MKAASMFSGIGGAELALPEADWLWCAEIEPFPSAVLAQRFGHPNLGDVLAPDFIDRALAFGRLDLLCGGPPCQAFSIAGNRLSMADPRGNLSLRFVQVAHAIRPRNLIVENVPGWLNTPDNAFGCFLGAIVGGDDAVLPCAMPARGKSNAGWKWRAAGKAWMLREPDEGGLPVYIDDPDEYDPSEIRQVELDARHVPVWPSAGMVAGPIGRAAWRVLDAQYAGLAQRRLRVFVVVDFGDGADPAAVLFERQGLLGNHPPRRETGEGITGTLSARAQGGGGLGTDFEIDGGQAPVCADIAPTLNAAFGEKQGLEDQHINGGGGCSLPPVSMCLNAGAMGRIDAESETLIPVNRCDFDDVAHTLRAEGFDASEECAVGDCEAKAHAKGFCKPHYSRWKRHGDPLAGRVAEGEPLAFLEQQRLADTGDCIMWPYGLFKTGYPSIYIDGANLRAHRVMCEWVNGAPRQPDLDAAHSCGNRACVNPRHLRWATRHENMADAVDHGTAPRGERHGGALLDEASVLKIVARLDAGDTHQAIADDFAVSRNTVTDIAKGKNWAWLTGRGVPLVPVHQVAGTLKSCGGKSGQPNGAEEVDRLIPICVHADAVGRTGEAKTPSADAEGRVRLRDPGMGIAEDVAFNVTTGSPHVVAFAASDYSTGQFTETDHAAPLTTGTDATRSAPIIAMQAGMVRENPNSGPNGKGWQEGVAYTLEARPEVQAVAFAENQRGELRTSDISPQVTCGGGKPGQGYPAVATNMEETNGQANETNAFALLRKLREEVGEEAFAQWGLGISHSLQSPEVLRQEVHGQGLRGQASRRIELGNHALSCPKNSAEGAVQSLWGAGCAGRPSPGWRPSEQLAEQLGAHLSQLPHSRTSGRSFLHDMWRAARGIGVLREALSAFQAVGRPDGRQGQSEYASWAVRRLTPTEAERLQGYPDNWTLIEFGSRRTVEPDMAEYLRAKGVIVEADNRTGKLKTNAAADGPRYKSLGNAWAVACVRPIAKRIYDLQTIERITG